MGAAPQGKELRMAREVKKDAKEEMFKVFGEFESAEEINKSAEGLLEEGDKENLYVLAEENGLDKEDVDDFIDGMGAFCTPFSAAVGKLNIEKKYTDKDTKMILNTIAAMAMTLCRDESFAAAVRGKGKSIKEIIGSMKSAAGKHKTGSMGVCCGTDKQLIAVIKAYYLDGKEAMEKMIESLY